MKFELLNSKNEKTMAILNLVRKCIRFLCQVTLVNTGKKLLRLSVLNQVKHSKKCK